MSDETKKVYISGWFEYRVDIPSALIDAARFTPEELDPEHKVPDLEELAGDIDVDTSLIVEVSKRFAQYPAPVPPGTVLMNRKVHFTLREPQDDSN